MERGSMKIFYLDFILIFNIKKNDNYLINK